MEELLTLIKALADSNRLLIVQLLTKHKYCVRALARELDISESAVSQHLKILREAGLIKGEKEGYWVHYRAVADELDNLIIGIKKLRKGEL